ncbi:tRNA (guanine(37)-N1)-methyltransferase Trm5b [Candidatus Norongarragalina meridionalis]|nr:tRNA (guanine(37)-N1)-methyltransferase Trm5b [Candidatus Norongarragalina meridionalis]
MLGIGVEKKNAERAKAILRENGALLSGYGAKSDEKRVYFPVSKRIELPFPHSYSQKIFPKKQHGARSLREQGLSSFDIVGDIAVLEDRGKGDVKKAASILLKTNPRIKTVLLKTGGRTGEFRIQQVKWLAGKKRTKTVHKESGCVFEVDLARAYFSPRLSTERLRVLAKVKDGETVLVPFAGVGPYAIIIAKNRKCRVVAIEKNKDAVASMRKNVAANRVAVEVVQGDANAILPRYKADRIIMPLPHGAFDFLDAALKAAKDGCVVHYYSIGERGNPFEKPLKEIRDACLRNRKKCRIAGKRVLLSYSAGLERAAVDFTVRRL